MPLAGCSTTTAHCVDLFRQPFYRVYVNDVGLLLPTKEMPTDKMAGDTRVPHLWLGMPEGGVALAQLVAYLAAAPKSNAAYVGYGEAVREVRQGDNPPVPLHIRNAPTGLMKDLGYGKGYKYAHDYEDQTVAMDCLPESLRNRRFYEPKDVGAEAEIKKRLERMRAARTKE